MKLALMRNYELKAMVLKIKYGDRWGKIQRKAQ
jgi:hypothetical protein